MDSTVDPESISPSLAYAAEGGMLLATTAFHDPEMDHSRKTVVANSMPLRGVVGGWVVLGQGIGCDGRTGSGGGRGRAGARGPPGRREVMRAKAAEDGRPRWSGAGTSRGCGTGRPRWSGSEEDRRFTGTWWPRWRRERSGPRRNRR